MLSLNAPHHAYYKTFIKNNNSPLTREEVTMLEFMLSLYKLNRLDKIKNNKEALKGELRGVRFMYNVWNCFSSGFILPFFGGFIGYIFNMKKMGPTYTNFFYIMIVFIIILLIQWIFVCVTYACYEKMELIEDELKKVDSEDELEKVDSKKEPYGMSVGSCFTIKKISGFDFMRHLMHLNFLGK